VWNPGPIKAAQLPDMPNDDWVRMLCVESARIGEPITLAPGEEWSGMQTLQFQS
jgi:glucose-6-phosphate 1-epimerase